MSTVQLLLAAGDRARLAQRLEQGWSEGRTLALAVPEEESQLREALPACSDQAWGAAVVLGTGGSSGGRRWCLQPLAHLQLAAAAAGRWLQEQGIDPARTEICNPLPLQHVSGLMPLLRARHWGAELRWLPPAWMRDAAVLKQQAAPAADRPALLSLVPTQLQRLMASPEGRGWLERFALIWVGGAALAPELAERCRAAGLRLAPCYGSTETGAMVASLTPQQFLAGWSGCGQPLPHAQLRLESGTGALQIRAGSLALGFCRAGRLEPLPLLQGWWRSGDRGRLAAEGLQLLGRLDGAIQSGAETVFPEQVEQRLLALGRAEGLPLAELLLLAEADPLWGERLLALVRPAAPGEPEALVAALELLARQLPPSQRPRRWLLCPQLERNALGKWERARWMLWAATAGVDGR